MSRSEKRDHFSLKVDFELVALSHSTVDGLSVALCCASIAASVHEIRLLKVQNTLSAITRKWPVTFPLLYP